MLLEDSGGDWTAYEEVLYSHFTTDFLDSLPDWIGKRVGLKKHPLCKGKEATFWHFISDGKIEDDRLPDIRRCERIRWPKPTMEAFTNLRPTADDRIVWWKNERRQEERYLLALPDFSYLMVVADRGDYVLPWTQYHVEHPHQRQKYQKEYDAYWEGQKC
ncbi:MAG: hypothetical protein WAO02_15595 [Verrucomicrobiia bacterium]